MYKTSLITLCLLFTQGNARTTSTSMYSSQVTGTVTGTGSGAGFYTGGMQVTGTVTGTGTGTVTGSGAGFYTGGKKISSTSSLISDENEYLDWVQFAQKAATGMSEEEINELTAEFPELQQLREGSPFNKNHVTGIIDDVTGVEVTESDIQELMTMNKIMQERFKTAFSTGTTGSQIHSGTGSTLSSLMDMSHHRKLQTGIGEAAAVAAIAWATGKVLEAVEPHLFKLLSHIDPVIWRLQKAYDEMNNYDEAYGAIAEARAAGNSEFTKENLQKADELAEKARRAVYTSYRWIKTSSRILYKLLKRIETQIQIRDMYEDKLDKYMEKQEKLNDMREKAQIEMTAEQKEQYEQQISSQQQELDKLYADIYKTEEEAHNALETYGLGIQTSEKYLKEAEVFSGESRNKVNEVKEYLIEKREEAWDNVQAKGSAYTKYAREQRAIAYGTCGGVCLATGIATGGMSCAACYTVAAAVLEDALADFREKNKQLREDYNDMADEMGVVLDSIMDRINALNDIDGDIESVGQLIEEVKGKYKEVKGADIDTFLTKTANDEEGPYTDFINMLEKIINYEKNIHQCGKPDCDLECMQEPIFNEGSDYKGCWNQTQRGHECKNWFDAGYGSDSVKGIDNHNFCRDPDNKGQAWCYLKNPEYSAEFRKSGQTWAYCVDV